MKAAAIGVCVGAIVTAYAFGIWTPSTAAWADRGIGTSVGGELITNVASVGDNRQLVTIIEPKTRVLAVYVVDAATGGVALKSVRNFHWDLQLSEFNGTAPLPREIQSLIEQNVR